MYVQSLTRGGCDLEPDHYKNSTPFARAEKHPLPIKRERPPSEAQSGTQLARARHCDHLFGHFQLERAFLGGQVF